MLLRPLERMLSTEDGAEGGFLSLSVTERPVDLVAHEAWIIKAQGQGLSLPCLLLGASSARVRWLC